MESHTLQRFIDAQEESYSIAFAEVKEGRKRGHWMWYIFPQIQGLGFSTTSKFYAIKDLHEAIAYLNHPVLGKRLVNICKELITNENSNARQIFGSPDDIKLKSCMTLFTSVADTDSIFQAVLIKFFNGEKDERTL